MSRYLIPTLCATLALLVGCGGGGKDDRGLRYMPDMYDSPAKKSQEAWRKPAEVDDEGKEVGRPVDVPMMLTPVEGSVPRDFSPYDIPDTPEGLELAKELVNPISPTTEVLRRGHERFDIFCAVCHGKDGQVANSFVAGEGRVQGIVSITTPTVNEMPDGQIYHIVTHGRGRMPNYQAQLLPEDRWAVIHYLRALHRATSAKGEELQVLERSERSGAAERFAPAVAPVPEYEQEDWPANIQREESK